ncbi:MAG: hypothetical protein H7A12_04015 [Pseudomonadales bacterium]|nr:hypothetical protein [Pseudomonadales bacterium]
MEFLVNVISLLPRRLLGQKRLSGVNATCDALVVGGGTRRNGEKLFYGVKLDIKPFD